MPDISIQIKMPGRNDNLFRVTISTTDTIQQVKEKVAAHCSTPAHRQRLIFAGRVLKDHQIVSECSKFKISKQNPAF